MSESIARANPLLSLAGQIYIWACERLYHEFAWSYDAVSVLVSAGEWDVWRAAALAHVKPGPVLELGFGTGALLAQMAQRGLHVTGLELSPQMHAQAARRLSAQGATAPRVRATAGAMPFASAAFATVISTFPSPYIFAHETLVETNRVLAPGGRLVIVGLWVRPTDMIRSRIPLFFGGPPQPLLEELAHRCAVAGLAASWHEEIIGYARVGLVLAEKPPRP